MMPTDLKVMVVDDTALYRKILSEAVARVPGLAMAAAVASGSQALARLAVEPCDLLLLDVFMPEMDGPAVLERVRREHPSVTVVMVSGATGRDAAVTVNALASGALDFIPKPQSVSYEEGISKLVAQLAHVERVVRLRRFRMGGTGEGGAVAARLATVESRPPVSTTGSVLPLRKHGIPPSRLELLVVGVSTGGPRALQEFLPRLPTDFPLPVLIVQHMPPVFTRTLAEQLHKLGPLPCAEAADGEPILPGRVRLAPGGRHLEVERRADGGLVARLTDRPPVNSCRPSVDVLFASVARAAPRGVLSVVLTGMGEDGADGVAALKAAGEVWSVAQDEATCVIYGMPQAVVRRGLADEVLPLAGIAPRVAELAARARMRG